jgi:hypothetical protein
MAPRGSFAPVSATSMAAGARAKRRPGGMTRRDKSMTHLISRCLSAVTILRG